MRRLAGAGNLFLFYATNYFEVFCKLNVVDFQKKIRMDWIQNYQLVSSCQAASCPPCKEVKISTQKQIYNIWQDHYWEFFWLKQNAERHIRVHSQIEFTLRRATEAELLWFGELRQVYKPENNPIRLFWVLKGFSWRFFCVFYFAKNKPWYNLLIFSFFACNTNQFVIWCSDQWPV